MMYDCLTRPPEDDFHSPSPSWAVHPFWPIRTEKCMEKQNRNKKKRENSQRGWQREACRAPWSRYQRSAGGLIVWENPKKRWAGWAMAAKCSLDCTTHALRLCLICVPKPNRIQLLVQFNHFQSLFWTYFNCSHNTCFYTWNKSRVFMVFSRKEK